MAPAHSPLESAPRRSKLGPLALALLIQVALLFLAVFVVVLVPEFKSDPEFVARKKIYLPQKELEHKVALAEFQNAASSAMQLERIRAQALLPDAMPSLPQLPKSDFNPIERNPAALQSDSLLGQSGVLGALQGLQTGSSSASLFGIEDTGERILILFDNSASVWNKASKAGVSTTRFIRELEVLIDGLNANTQFALVPFSRSIGSFRDYMIAGGARNKRAAKVWMTEKVRSQSLSTQLPHAADGIQGALTVAFQMEPDVIFLISDGDFQRNIPRQGDVPWEELERSLRELTREYGIQPRLHFIGFQVEPEAVDWMQKLTRRYKGQFKKL
ncbi:VWA domain-containing protein [Coraliomargarita sp. SDUM461004]|uniref:VWA domain-containing protein n=1 Tax=Thalassobacterium sedimentorum TaxID=3041258 RepID=A0ABU1AGD6_9BACT|nr:VWA domain-containing protein [Coraliomargarita sp. SDUM461004]MDQ8193233.1 VWA domain-containing protein [Coraliomargarita sp. SDUM461004]